MDVPSTTLDSDLQRSPQQHHPSQKVLLSIDDGGMRTLVSLYILECLMRHVQQVEEEEAYATSRPNELRPCDYFDFVIGSGSGGLLAVMLGRLQMNMKECREYLVECVVNTAHSRSLVSFMIPFKGHHNSAVLEHWLKELIVQQAHSWEDVDIDQPLMVPDQAKCKTAMLMYSDSERHGPEPDIMFRSYEHETPSPESGRRVCPSGRSDIIPVWKLLRASLSRPDFFSRYKVYGHRVKDAGRDARNPAFELIQEAANVEKGREDCIACLVSVGSGLPKEVTEVSAAHREEFCNLIDSQRGRLRSMELRARQNAREWLGAYTADSGHHSASSTMRIKGKPYFRLDAVWESWDVSLEDIDTGKLESKVKRLLQEEPVAAQLKECARILVARRRAREQPSQDE